MPRVADSNANATALAFLAAAEADAAGATDLTNRGGSTTSVLVPQPLPENPVSGPSGGATEGGIPIFGGTLGNRLRDSGETLATIAYKSELEEHEHATSFVHGIADVTDLAKKSALGSLAYKNTVATGDIDNDAVTFAKMQNVATSTVLGRFTAGTGDPEEISLGGGLEFNLGSLRTSALTDEVTTTAGATTALVALLRNKRVCQVLKDPGAATATAIGVPAPTLDGATVANGDGASGPIVIHITTALVNSVGGLVSADFTRFRRDWQPELNFRIATQGSVAEIRFWIGMFSASPDAVGDLTTIHGAAFRYDTGVDGTAFWRCVTGNNSGADTTTTTSVAVSTSTFYTMRIVCSNTTPDVKFYINGTLVATHTATLPTSTQLMGYGARVTTLAAVTAKRIGWGRMLLLHD